MSKIKKIVTPIIKNYKASPIASAILGVQPMSSSSGDIFSLNYDPISQTLTVEELRIFIDDMVDI